MFLPFFALFPVCLARGCLIRDASVFNLEPETLSKRETQNQLIRDERQQILTAWYCSGRVKIVIINWSVYSQGKHWVSAVCWTLGKRLELQRFVRRDFCPQSTRSGGKERQTDNCGTLRWGLRQGVSGVLRAWKRGEDRYLCHKQGSNQTRWLWTVWKSVQRRMWIEEGEEAGSSPS